MLQVDGSRESAVAPSSIGLARSRDTRRPAPHANLHHLPFFAKNGARSSVDQLEREWMVSSWLAAACPSASAIAPKPLSWDGRLLRFEWLHGQDLCAFAADQRSVDTRVAARVAVALALIHADTPVTSPFVTQARPRTRLHRPGPEFVTTHSAAGIDLVKLIQRSTRLCALLDRLPDNTATHFVHGDLRWENVFISGDGLVAPEVRIVDWEHAGLGDPAWDLGCFVASAIASWIDSFPEGAPPDLDIDELAKHARRDLRSAKTAIKSFLESYAGARRLDVAERWDITVRALREAAVRLIHLTLESTTEVEDLSLVNAISLQVATNVLADLQSAAGEWCDAFPPPTRALEATA